jgi:hypothetical protein
MTKGPALTPLGIRTAVALAKLAAFDLEVLALILTGDVDDTTLARLEVPEDAAARLKPTPAQVADALISGTTLPAEQPGPTYTPVEPTPAQAPALRSS